MAGKRKRSGPGGTVDRDRKRSRLSGIEARYENTVKNSILTHYYPRVLTLGEYLRSKLPSDSKARRKRIANVESSCASDGTGGEGHLGKLLVSTLVGVLEEGSGEDRRAKWTSHPQLESSSESTMRTRIYEGTPSQSEIVDLAIWQLFNNVPKSESSPKHILCQGYRKDIESDAVHRSENATSTIPGLVLAYPNRNIKTLKSFPWPEILLLIGKEGSRVMLDLISHCGIFVAVDVGQGNYYQLSGKPLGDLLPLKCMGGMSKLANPLRSDVHRTGIGKPSSDPIHTPGTIRFARSRMLYARAALNSKGCVRFGLRHIHVLNRFPYRARKSKPNPATDSEGVKNDSENSKVLQSTIHVIMYIFPRQFGLHNVFTSSVDQRETVQPLKDYTLREEEINRKYGASKEQSEMKTRRKLPNRLRGRIVELIQKLRINHSRCSYHELLMHYCPNHNGRIIDSRLSLESEVVDESTTFKTQESNSLRSTSTGSSTTHPAISTLRRTTLMNYATPNADVSAFCCAVLTRLIPGEMWGDGEIEAHNKLLLLAHVERFISMRRFESLSLHDILQGMKIHTISWLAPRICATRGTCRTDTLKRLEIFSEFIYYVFDSILVPLIRGNFYVTESNAHQYRLFYFRHDVWRSVAEPSLASIKLSMLGEVKLEDARKILSARSLGYSQLRLLPKETGVRPIMNLRRRTVKKGCKTTLGSSINSILTPVFKMLTFEKNENPGLLGSTITSVGDLYDRLKTFKSQLVKPSSSLFFVKVDVQSAFDTIPQTAVLQLMATIPQESQYRIWKHVEIKPGEGHRSDIEGQPISKPIRKWVSRAVSAGTFPSSIQSPATDVALNKKNTIFVENVVNQVRRREDLMELLAEHVQYNMVKIGKKFYRQKKGIPQGSVLSSLLCNYFYADLEAHHLGFLKTSNGSLLLRLMDDFLLITTNRGHAKRFLQIMHGGLPVYGVAINPLKTLTNFEVCINDLKIARLVGSHQFPYCGNLIDTKTLEVSKDRERRKDSPIIDTLTVEFSRIPRKVFCSKILNAFRIQAHTMFFDMTLNTSSTVFSNIYGIFIETATKLWQYSKCLPAEKRPGAAFTIRTISKLIDYAFLLLKSKAKSHKNPGYRCTVTHLQIEWLAITAFNSVLQRKQSRYRDVVHWLESRIQALRSENSRGCIQLTNAVLLKTSRKEDL